MLYGMTTRFRCADPQPVWRVWDAFGIETAEMIGYWEVRRTLTLSLTLSLTVALSLTLTLTLRLSLTVTLARALSRRARRSRASRRSSVTCAHLTLIRTLP